MDRSKNDTPEKLLYIDPPRQQNKGRQTLIELDPEMSERSRKIKEQGTFRAVVLPALKENPLVPFGATMFVLTFGYSIFCAYRGQKNKAEKYMYIQYGFQVLTFAAITGGFFYRDYKKTHQKSDDTKDKS